MQTHCPHCSPDAPALAHFLEETPHFRVVCDAHPITEGHLLIIPKKHISCIGACDGETFQEFRGLYNQWSERIRTIYGTVHSFEHGVIGQTVFHAHVHLLPYAGTPGSIVPEGRAHFTKMRDLSELRQRFAQDGHYLFFSIGKDQWFVDTSLGVPRFFRDRFALALGRPERGNCKIMHENKKLMVKAEREIQQAKDLLLKAV